MPNLDRHLVTKLNAEEHVKKYMKRKKETD